MFHTVCNRVTALAGIAALSLIAAPAHAAGGPDGVGWTPAAAIARAQASPIVSSRVSTSDAAAELVLELDDGRTLRIALDDGSARVDGDAVGSYEPGDALDRSWRELLASLNGSMTAVARRLHDWEPPANGAGERIDTVLENALGAVGGTAAAAQAAAEPAQSLADSVERLRERIEEMRRNREAELERMLEDADAEAGFLSDLRRELRADLEQELRRELRRDRAGDDGWWVSPFRYLWRGFSGILATLALYAVVAALGVALVVFARRNLERVADTARHQTVRSLLVGLAGSFLVLPAYLVGTLALTISIIGIPLLIAWTPLFPLAVAAALIFGYLGVGHAAGEAMAERRFYGGEWFKRANSYYYVLTGVALLFALFILSNAVEMAGPWFGFIQGLLTFLGVVLTWAAFTIGLGAVLLTRAGTRTPEGVPSPTLEPEPVTEEESRV